MVAVARGTNGRSLFISKRCDDRIHYCDQVVVEDGILFGVAVTSLTEVPDSGASKTGRQTAIGHRGTSALVSKHVSNDSEGSRCSASSTLNQDSSRLEAS